MDTISGGTIPTDGVVKLTIDSDKIGLIVYPDGSVGETTLGVIDNIWGGDTGSITYYVPKILSNQINLGFSSVSGNLIYTGYEFLNVNDCDLITGVLANFASGVTVSNSGGIVNINTLIGTYISATSCTSLINMNAQNAGQINTTGSTNLSNVIALKVSDYNATYCALTTKSIGDILYSAYVDNRANVNFDFSGGTNAVQSDVASYVDVTYGVELVNDIIDLLVTTNGGIISLNP